MLLLQQFCCNTALDLFIGVCNPAPFLEQNTRLRRASNACTVSIRWNSHFSCFTFCKKSVSVLQKWTTLGSVFDILPNSNILIPQKVLQAHCASVLCLCNTMYTQVCYFSYELCFLADLHSTIESDCSARNSCSENIPVILLAIKLEFRNTRWRSTWSYKMWGKLL